jgi:hypothetical protein
VAIIATIVGLVTVSLRTFRASAREVQVVALLGQHAGVFAAYAHDYRDAFPCYVDPKERSAVFTPASTGFSIGVSYFGQSLAYSVPMADAYYGGRHRIWIVGPRPTDRVLPDLATGLFFVPDAYGGGTIDYSVTCLADPDYFTWRLDRSLRTMARGMSVYETTFPSDKFHLYEHRWRNDPAIPGRFRSAQIDGSAKARSIAALSPRGPTLGDYYPDFVNGPLSLAGGWAMFTHNGLHGRDFE